MLQKDKMPRIVWLWLQEQNRAFFIGEIRKQFGMSSKKATKVMSNLKRQKFVVSSRRYVDVDGSLGSIYGLSKNLVRQRVIEYLEQKRINPTTHIRGKLGKPIVALFKRLRELNYSGGGDGGSPVDFYDVGLTVNEIKTYLNDEKITNRQISKACALLGRKRRVLHRSRFTLPQANMSEDNDKGFVFSISERGVWNGIERLMPPSVKESLNILTTTGSVLSGWELRNRTGITTENQINWLRYRFADKMGLLKYRVQDGISYYYYHSCSDEYVKRIMGKYSELSRNWRVDTTMKGYRFEERALWIYVYYKKAKGYDIKLPPGFPHVIPNWLNKEERDKYKIEYKDDNGFKRVDWTCSIFRFNREPVDFVLFLREKASKEVHTYIITVKNDTTKRFGVKYYTSFLGCIQSGRSFNGSTIPNHKGCRAVFICSDTYGRDIYDYNNGFSDNMSGQLGSIITENRLKEMCDEVRIEYPYEKEYQKALELTKAHNLYQNHEDVLLGKKTVMEILSEKGYDVKQQQALEEKPAKVKV